MMMNKPIILINLWGLGDLIATLHIIKIHPSNNYQILTRQNPLVIKKMIDSFDIYSDIKIIAKKSRVLLSLHVLRKMLSNNILVFTSPLSGKSRKFAVFLSFFRNDIILSQEGGNIYKNNEIIANQFN
ncbi:MAG: hypothetical protein CMD72_04035 [Gammaproteobacteria bacterium]|nr:hypothetical protein [Gammaproteobacteria bacterium]